MRSLLAICTLLAALPAQFFIVDVNNGPGAQFTSIAAAAVAVPSGATLLVRPGSYQGFTINAKALTILGDPGVAIVSSVRVDNTVAGQQVTLAGLDLQGHTPGVGTMLAVANCDGPVLIDRVTTPANMPLVPLLASFWTYVRGLHALNARQVAIRSSTITNAALSQSHSLIESSLMRGSPAGPSPGLAVTAMEGLLVAGGTCHVAGATDLRGGDGAPGFLDAPGLNVNTATMTVRSGTIRSGSGANASGGVAMLIVNATLRIDPAVVITATSAPTLGTPPTILAMPSLASSGAPPGGTMQATVTTVPGDAVILAIGLLGPRAALPPFPEPAWLNPALAWPHAIGVQQPTAPVSATTNVPNVAALRGITLAWQAGTFGSAGPAITNASLAIVE